MLATVLAAAAGVAAAPRLGTFLVVSHEPATADATLLTYSVNSFARPLARQAALSAAADRYAAGDGAWVLISSFRSDDEEFRTKVALANRYLLRRGVEADKIEVLPDVSSEYEEGKAVRKAVEGRGWRRLVVLAPDFRSRRTAGTLGRALSGSGVEPLTVSVRDPAVDLQHWWRTRDGVEAVVGEYVRLAYYFAAGRL